MNIGELCNRVVIYVSEDESVLRAAELMRKYHIGNLVVIQFGDEDKVPIGVVTDRDIVVEVVSKGIDPEELTVGDIMSANPLMAHIEDSVSATLDAMREHGVRRVPVVDATDKLVGVVSLDDLLRLLATNIGTVASIVSGQRRKESAVRA